MCAVCFSAPVKSNIGAKGIEYIDGETAIPTAADYVQDGLVAMWDGIENAGWGVHDDEAIVWKDLVGDLDLRCNRTPVWNRDEAVISGWNTYFYAVADSISEAFNNHSVTVEILYGSVITAANNSGPFGIGDSSFSQVWPVYVQQNRAANTACNIVMLGQSTWQPSSWFLGRGNGENYHIAISVEGSVIGARSISPDGIWFSEYKNASFSSQIEYGSIFSIGRSYNHQMPGWCVRCVRVYDRAISDREMQYNHKIDNLRFNLP